MSKHFVPNPSLALIGIGKWGQNLARNFHNLGVLHTVCDSDESLLDKYQHFYPNVTFTSNLNNVLQNPLITQIAIATPALTHYYLTKQALIANKDVFVEKPLCLNLVEAEELVSIAKDKQRILMVGHILHYHPCIERLQDLVEARELGTLNYIAAHRLNNGTFRREENSLWDLAPHDVSVILSFCNGQAPQKIHCQGSLDDQDEKENITLTTLFFHAKFHAHIYVSRLNPFKEHKLVVIGTLATAIFDDTKPWKEKLVIHSQEKNTVISEFIDIPQSEPLREECLHFLESCHSRIQPKTDGEEALSVMRILYQAQICLEESHKSQKVLQL